jgi:cobalt-zinc-cadmium efflux system outer membrane protein
VKNATSIAAVVLSLGLAGIGRAQMAGDGPEPPRLTLADLERIALEKNPTLVQAQAEIEAARGRTLQAGLLPNPVIGYSAEDFAYRAGVGHGKQGVFIETTIPLGGKLALGRAVFSHEIAEAEANFETQRLRVLNSIRALYWESLISARRVQVRERLAALSDEAVRVSHQLYNVGAADRPDVLEAEIESRETRLALVAARNQQHHTWLSLATMIGEPDRRVQPLGDIGDEAPPELDRDEAVAALLRESPQLKSARARLERAAATLRSADRVAFPDLFLRFGSDWDRVRVQPSGQPVGWEASVEAGISIPIFNGNAGGKEAARAKLERSQAEVERVELALRSRVSAIFEAYLNALRMAEEYSAEILPRAEEAYRLYLERFREMAAAYPQVLIAQRTLFQTSERYLSALEEVHVAALQIRGFLVVDGLEAPPAPGESDPDIRASELPGAVRAGELPISIRRTGEE